LTSDSSDDLIARSRRSYREAHDRLVARLRNAPEDAVHRAPADGGWSAAQIGWHVAAVDGQFADLVSGARPGAQPLAEGAAEKPWAAVVSGMPQRIEAGRRVQPPPDAQRDAVLAMLEESAAKLDAESRALLGLLLDGATEAEAAAALRLEPRDVRHGIQRILRALRLDVPTARTA